MVHASCIGLHGYKPKFNNNDLPYVSVTDAMDRGVIYNLMKGMIILRIFLFHHGILEPPMKTNLCHSQFVLML